MPELPEVETVRLALEPHVVGEVVTDVRVRTARLRTPLSGRKLAEHAANRRIIGLQRRGKFLVAELEGRRAFVLHLGMSGSFRVVPQEIPFRKHEHVAWELSNGMSWRLCDPRRFGWVIPCCLAAEHALPALLKDLGPEPLDGAFSGAYLYTVTRARKATIKDLLMDQRVVAGIGNIYANEALYRAGISPRRRAGNVGKARCAKLAESVKGVLADALACGGTTIRDYASVNGSEGHFQVCLDVYGREGESCGRCPESVIKRTVVSGRSTYYCPRCQR